MILSETSSRKPSRIGFWIVLGLGALLLPLAPQTAQTQAPEKPKRIETKDPPVVLGPSLNLVTPHENPFVGKMNNCLSCHEATVHGHDFDGKPQSWKHSHDEIVRLLDEVRTRRKQLQEAEDRLNRALVALKRLETHTDPHGNLNWGNRSWNVTWAEAMFDRRTVDVGSVNAVAYVTEFSMTNRGQHTIHIANVRTSAGCLSAVSTKDKLAPGESAAIRTRLDTSSFVGYKTFKVYVEFDKPEKQEVVLEIRANRPAAAPAKSQSPERLQQLEKKLDELRKEMENLRRDMRPDKPHDPGSKPASLRP